LETSEGKSLVLVKIKVKTGNSLTLRLLAEFCRVIVCMVVKTFHCYLHRCTCWLSRIQLVWIVVI